MGYEKTSVNAIQTRAMLIRVSSAGKLLKMLSRVASPNDMYPIRANASETAKATAIAATMEMDQRC